MKTRTQKLTAKIQDIYLANNAEIDNLPTIGKNGGSNAAYIDGWENYGNGTITRAANLSGLPVLNYWSGSNPTPSSAMPSCVRESIISAYNKIFN